MRKITVAIDGYSSCGKSTLAKSLAAKMGYTYIDSGAMYRAVTLYCLRRNCMEGGKLNNEKVIELVPEVNVHLTFNPFTKSSETYLNDENVESQIRTMEVASWVSKVSAIKEVRQHLLQMQREFGANKGVIMDGRDIGSHVFPDADLKLFMTADHDVRTRRRMDELWAKGNHVSFEEVRNNLQQRDYDDTHRKESPLVKAKDAIVLDNSDLTPEGQLEFVIRLINDLLLTKDSFVDKEPVKA